MRLFACLLLAASSTMVLAQGTRAYCALDEGPAVPCVFSDRVADGNHMMEFGMGDRRVRFVGRSQTGWWSGTLDGRPAMGIEMNRGHIRFSTTDLKTSFAWWYEGREHGTY